MDCFDAKTKAKAGPGGWGQRNLSRRRTGGCIGSRQDAMSTRLFNLKTAVAVTIRQTLRWSPRLGPCCRPRALTRRPGCRIPSLSGAEWRRHPVSGACWASG